MGLIDTALTGIKSLLFSLGYGVTRIFLKNNGGVAELRDSTDTTYVVVRGAKPVLGNDLTTKDYVDQLAKPLIVTAQFNGTLALPANTATRRFLVVTTSGGTATIGQLLFDDGTGVGTMTVMLALEGRTIAVTDALTGGTISFDADTIAIWDADNGRWITNTVAGGIQEIRFTVGTATASSVTLIPTGARVLRARVQINTPYSAGATLDVGKVGTVNLVFDNSEIDETVADTYLKDLDAAWGAAASVLTTIGGGPVAGASTIIVEYAMPQS